MQLKGQVICLKAVFMSFPIVLLELNDRKRDPLETGNRSLHVFIILPVTVYLKNAWIKTKPSSGISLGPPRISNDIKRFELFMETQHYYDTD